MQRIKTNEMICRISYNLFNDSYDICQITSSCHDKSFSFYSSAVTDAPHMDNRILSVLHKPYRDQTPSCVYVLFKKHFDNIHILRDCLKDIPGFEFLSIHKVNAENLDKCDLIQLCFNSLSNSSDNEGCFGNISGNLYFFSLLNMKVNKKTRVIHQIPSIQIKISPKLCISLNLTTFSNISLFDKKSKSIQNKPKYVLKTYPFFFLERLFGNAPKNENVFIIKQFKDKKNSLAFLDVSDLNKFTSSKIGILQIVMDSFNEKFGSIISLEFKEISNYSTIEHSRSQVVRQMTKRLTEYLNSTKLIIADYVSVDAHTESERNFIQNITSELADFFVSLGADVSIQNNVSDVSPSIALIHDASYYDSNNTEDPHKSFPEKVCQSITLEQLKEFKGNKTKGKPPKLDSLARNLLFQVVIKDDIKNGRFSLFDWSLINNSMVFSLRCGEKNEKVAEMRVDASGNFTISYKSPHQISFFDDLSDSEDNMPQYCINLNSGEKFIVCDTNWFTVPEFQKIKQALGNTEKSLSRSLEARNEFLCSCTDIKCFPIDDYTLGYFVGVIGSGMGRTLAHAVNIKLVTNPDAKIDSQSFVSFVLPLMDVLFVRNSQLTVLPFPFKYLREWELTHCNKD